MKTKIPKGYRIVRLGESLVQQDFYYISRPYYIDTRDLSNLKSWTKDKCSSGWRFTKQLYDSYKVIIKKT